MKEIRKAYLKKQYLTRDLKEEGRAPLGELGEENV